MRAASLLDGPPDRERIAKGLAGHLCRCTGYTRIVDAVASAAEAWQEGPAGRAPSQAGRISSARSMG